jgi:hypothetical protein
LVQKRYGDDRNSKYKLSLEKRSQRRRQVAVAVALAVLEKMPTTETTIVQAMAASVLQVPYSQRRSQHRWALGTLSEVLCFSPVVAAAESTPVARLALVATVVARTVLQDMERLFSTALHRRVAAVAAVATRV